MRTINRVRATAIGLALGLYVGVPAFADPEAWMDLFPTAVVGDFNGDGIDDAIVPPRAPSSTGAVLLGSAESGAAAGRVVQDLSPADTSLPWAAPDARVLSGDFNGDGRDDLLVQSPSFEIASATVLADPMGRFHTPGSILANGALGLDWSVDRSAVTVGDLDGDGHADVVVRSIDDSGQHTVVLSDDFGTPSIGPQAWRDGFLGRTWNARQVQVYSGDFNGDRRADLLLQVVDDGVLSRMPFETAYALLLADEGGTFSAINDSWDRDALDAEWSPKTHLLRVLDVDGDGISDIVLRARKPGGMNYLTLGTPRGAFQSVSARWRGNGTAADVHSFAQQGFIQEVDAQRGVTFDNPNGGGQDESFITMAMSSFPAGVPAVGALAGEAGVGGGAATYTIPIVVPPGRAGMQPSISLSYSSRGGNGEMGMGWSLGVGSSIHRCGQSAEIAGEMNLGVQLNASDRLCLDGQRLMLFSGTYGSNNAVYRTELENYARVKQTGGAFGSVNSKFQVTYNDGRVAYYGQTANSVFASQYVTTPSAWLLSRVEDPATNSIIYTYDRSIAGEHPIANITYTGRGTSAGNRSVEFLWEARSDTSTSWQAGGRSMQTKRLQMIRSFVAGAMVREYRMYYGDDSAATTRTLLASVEECALGGATLYCLPKTDFSWNAAATSLGLPSGWQNAAHTLDAGKMARIAPVADTMDTVAQIFQQGSAATFYQVRTGASFLGNGQKEVWYQSTAEGIPGPQVVLMLPLSTATSTPGAIAAPQNEPWPSIGASQFWDYDPDPNDRFYDMNNDGRVDHFRQTSIDFAMGDQGAFTGWGKVTTVTSGPDATDYKIADFNGDGRADVVAVVRASSGSNDRRIVLWKNIQDQSSANEMNVPSGETMLFAASVIINNPVEYQYVPGLWTGAQLSHVTDYNGDGRPDIIYRTDEDTAAGTPGPLSRVLINNSTKTTISFAEQATLTDNTTDRHLWADVNGDGLQDLMIKGVGGAWNMRINKGGSTFAATQQPGIPGVAPHLIRSGDIDNDGKDELIVAIARVASICQDNVMVQTAEGWEAVELCGGEFLAYNPSGASMDASIYEFAAYRINENSDGTLSSVDTGIRFKAPGTGFEFGDVNADGLNDLIWSVNAHPQQYYAETGSIWWGNQNGCTTQCAFTFPVYGNYVSFALQAAPDLMSSAKDGLGREARWTLSPLSSDEMTLGDGSDDGAAPDPFYALPDDSSGYSDDNHFYFTSTMYAVAEFKTTHFGSCFGAANCDSTWSIRKYGYREAMYNNQGRGFRGFRSIIEDDTQRGIRTTSTYTQKFPYGGQLEASTTELLSGTLIASTVNIWEDKVNTVTGRTQVRLVSSTSVSKDPFTGTTISTSSSTPAYDGNSCPSLTTPSVEVTTDQFGTRSSSSLTQVTTASETNNLFCQVTQRNTTHSSSTAARHGQAAHAPASTELENIYSYNTRRQVTLESVESRDSPFTSGVTKRTTTYGYEESSGQPAFGNLKSVTISGGAGATQVLARTTNTAWSADGYFPATVTNPLGHMVSSFTDAKHGQPTLVTDPNGVDTLLGYDAFGRKASAQVEDLPVQTVAYSTCNGCDSSARAKYAVTTGQAGQPTQTAYFDALNRAVQSRTAAFIAGTSNDVDTVHDSLGRVRWTSEPHAGGAPNEDFPFVSPGTALTYDAIDRLATKLDAKGLTTSNAYDGGIVTVTATGSGITQVATQEKNSAGQLITAIDHDGAKTHFRYDALGNPTRIVDAIGAVVTAGYNGLGQKTSLNDPDLGSWAYAYNVVGELKTQTDAKGQVTTFAYDNLGRMISRGEPGSGGSCTTGWAYDTAPHGVGKPASITSGANCESPGYRQDFAYDAKGRVTDVIETIDGVGYAITSTFDALGRLETLAYPDVAAGGSGPPGAPTNLATDPSYSLDGNVDLTWSAPISGGAPTEYRAYHRRFGFAWAAYDSLSGSTFLNPYTGLANGVHEFKVVACNASGCSPDSEIVEAEVSNGGQLMAAVGGGVSTNSLTSSFGARFTVKNVYNANGYLAEVQDNDGGGLIWRANALTDYGLVQTESFGNGVNTTRQYEYAGAPFVTGIDSGSGSSNGVQALDYTWNAFGQLLNRSSTVTTGLNTESMSETFSYDLLNRVRTSTLAVNGGSAVVVLDVTYDAVGNIQSKLDTTGTKTYTYPAASAARPHAVTSAGGTNYGYDLNGNMNLRNGSAIGWNAANLPTAINSGSFSSTFAYGANRNRVKETSTYVGRTETTVFAGSLYERFSRTDQAGTQHRYRVFAYGRPVAQVTDFSSTGIREASYLHGDHLGSVDAISDENGAVVSRMSFDAHGNRRAASSAQGATWMARLAYPANASAIDALRGTTPRGFTDHEMLDNVGLIHMNGRVYDPGIGRFLSVDPVFQFPENTQSLNPYSYVLNSPLTMTDPTGLMGSCTGEDFDMPCGGFGSNGGLMQNPGDNYNCDACSAPGNGGGRSKTSAITIAGGSVMSRENGGSVAIDGNTLADFTAGGNPSEIESQTNGNHRNSKPASDAGPPGGGATESEWKDVEEYSPSVPIGSKRTLIVGQVLVVRTLTLAEAILEEYLVPLDAIGRRSRGPIENAKRGATGELVDRNTYVIAVDLRDIKRDQILVTRQITYIRVRTVDGKPQREYAGSESKTGKKWDGDSYIGDVVKRTNYPRMGMGNRPTDFPADGEYPINGALPAQLGPFVPFKAK